MTAVGELEDVTYRDATFSADTVVLVCAHTGKRDAGTYQDPDRFDITAHRGFPKPLTFGAGPHHCLGANLARAELQEALADLAPGLTGLNLDGDPEFGSIDGIYRLHALPVRWSPAATG